MLFNIYRFWISWINDFSPGTSTISVLGLCFKTSISSFIQFLSSTLAWFLPCNL